MCLSFSIIVLVFGLFAVFYLPICGLIAAAILWFKYEPIPKTEVVLPPTVYPPMRKVSAHELWNVAVHQVNETRKEWEKHSAIVKPAIKPYGIEYHAYQWVKAQWKNLFQ